MTSPRAAHPAATRPPRLARLRLAIPCLLAGLVAGLVAGGCGVSDDQVAAIGAEESAKLEQQLPMVRDPQLTGYLDALGQRLAAAAEGGDRQPWTFHLVNSEQVNAFALPGGYVYVNRGLLSRTRTLSELAGVLGHEIGHVTMRHSADRLEKTQRTTVAAQLLCTLTSVCDSQMGRAVVSVGGNALLSRFSRTDELEADSVAVRYLVRAGLDPDGVPRMFSRLLEERGRRPAAVEAWFGTHPLEEERIDRARRLIEAVEGDLPDGLVTDDERFQRFRALVAALPPAPVPPRAPAP